MKPVILSGGSGARLWPLSLPDLPKQFLELISENSLFQECYERARRITDQSAVIIANHKHREILEDQLANFCNTKQDTIIYEEKGRNTAPAIAIAALQIIDNNPDEIMIVLPSDHVIQNEVEFARACSLAIDAARDNSVVILGVTPNAPNVNYGYIQRGDFIFHGAYTVKKFQEKPELKQAEHYMADGGYLWNSGIYVFKASTYIKQLEQHRPNILHHAKQALGKSEVMNNCVLIPDEYYKNCEKISIDYAIMENTNHAVVIPVDMGWRDVGSWDSLLSIVPKNNNRNFLQRNGYMTDKINRFSEF